MKILVVVVSLVLAAAAVGYVLLDTDSDEIEALQVEIAQLRTDLANLQFQEPPSTSTTVAPATTPPPPTSTFAVVTTTTKAPPTGWETESLLPQLSDMPLGWSPVQVSSFSESWSLWCTDSALWKVLKGGGGKVARSCFANGLDDPVYRVRLEVAGFPEISQATDLVQHRATGHGRDLFLHSKGLGAFKIAYNELLSIDFAVHHTNLRLYSSNDPGLDLNTCWVLDDWCRTYKQLRGLLEVYESALGPEGSVTRVSDVQVFDGESRYFKSNPKTLTREISITHNVGYCVLNMHMWVRNEEETALYFDEDSFGLAAAIAEMFMTDFNESLEECIP